MFTDFEPDIPKARSVWERLQKKSSLKDIGKAGPIDTTTTTTTDNDNSTLNIELDEEEGDETDDDVFLESVVVEVPELPKITDSISNRIKRRLRKVFSLGSNEEGQLLSESERRATTGRASTIRSTLSEDIPTSSDPRMSFDIPSTSTVASSSAELAPPPPLEKTTSSKSLTEKEKRVLEYRRGKLVKSESMNMERDTKWRNYLQRRKSSLDELRVRLPDV